MKLEEIIAANKDAFDEEIPSHIWPKIARKVKPTFTLSWKHFAAAACLILMASVGYVLGYKQRPDATVNLSMENAEIARFTKNVASKRLIFDKLSKEHPALGEQFKKDIEMLQAEYESLTSQLENNSNQEEIIMAMIQNLQYQLEILNKQNSILEQETQKNDRYLL